MIKSAEFILVSLLARVCSTGPSHVFSFVKEPVNLKRAGNYLVKMNCHVCSTDTYNEISVGRYQRGNVGNKRGANPLALLRLNSFFRRFFQTLLCPFIIRIVSHLVIPSFSSHAGARFKELPRDDKIRFIYMFTSRSTAGFIILHNQPAHAACTHYRFPNHKTARFTVYTQSGART